MSIDEYSADVARIHASYQAGINAYARHARATLASDVEARREALRAQAAGADALAGVAGVVFGPREHALTLAWLLDPERSGLRVLDQLTRALDLPAARGPLSVSHDARTVDARVFDVRVDGDGWRLALALGEAPTNPPDHMLAALDGAFGAGTADATHLIWLTLGGQAPSPQWTPLTWHTLDHILAAHDTPTVAEYRRVLREQVFRALPPSAIRRNLGTADHRALCAMQEGDAV